MSDTSIEARISALEGRVADLERQRWEGPPRLGPQPPTAEEVAERTEKFIESIKPKIDAAKHEHETDPEGRQICTTSGDAPSKVRADQRAEGNTGQHSSYIVLCEEERRKGFVRPYRDAYKHVGREKHVVVEPEGCPQCGAAQSFLRPADIDPNKRLCLDCGHVFMPRMTASGERTGGCNTVTTMGRPLSETYARDPKFYGSTFCVNCNAHFPVAEFVWTADGQEVGT